MITYGTESSIGERVSALVLGPFVGLAYVVCMPFLAIATIATVMSAKVLGGAMALLRTLVSFGWRPSEAYLSGKKKRKRRG